MGEMPMEGDACVDSLGDGPLKYGVGVSLCIIDSAGCLVDGVASVLLGELMGARPEMRIGTCCKLMRNEGESRFRCLSPSLKRLSMSGFFLSALSRA